MQEYVFDYRQYKKNVSKKNKFSPLIFIIIIALLGLAVYLKPSKKLMSCFYFVSAGEYLSYNDAKNVSSEIIEKQGAGFIHYDGTYHVLISFYPTEKSAKNVLEQIKNDYKNACIYKMEIEKFKKIKNFNAEQNELLNNLYIKNNNTIKKLYDLFIDYQKNQLPSNEFLFALKEIERDYSYSDFDKNFTTNSKYYQCKKYLISIKDSLKNIVIHIENNQELSKINYEIIKIAISHQSFFSCF